MSYCACRHCGEPRECKVVAGIHIDGPCSAGCDGKPLPRIPVDRVDLARLVVEDGMKARAW